MNFQNTNFYDILGVTRNASQENIYRAYYTLLHGDADSQIPIWLTDARKNVEKAYAVLSDSRTRTMYDEYLSKNGLFVSNAKDFNEYMKEVEKQRNDAWSSTFDLPQTPTAKENETVQVENKPLENEGPDYSENHSEEILEEPLSTPSEPEAVEQPVEQVQEEVRNNEEVNLTEENPEIATDSVGEATNAGTLVNEENRPLTYKGRGYHEVLFTSKVNLADKARYKLEQDKKEKRISDVKIQEKEATIAYLEVLDKALNKMISEPHSYYRIDMTMKKYELQIEYLKKLLDIKMNRKVNGFWDKHWNKLEVIAVAQEIAKAQKDKKELEKKVAEYQENNKIDLLRDRLLESSNVSLSDNKIAIERLKQSENPKKIKLKNLEIKSPKLQKRRDMWGENLKLKVYRNNNQHEIVSGLQTFTRFKYWGTRIDDVDDVVNEMINSPQGRSV